MSGLTNQEMRRFHGGTGTVCGVAVGATFASFFINPWLGAYLTSKAIGICMIDHVV